MNQETTPKTEGQAGVGSSAVFAVDDVIRVRCQAGFRVWKVTAVAYGGIGHENLLAIVPLDQHPGSIYGKTVEECLVPLSLLAGVERVVSANVSDQIPRTQDVANTTDSPERLSASVLFGPFVVVRTLCEELLTEAGCPPWKVDALQATVNAVNQIMMMSPGEIHLNSGNIREAISNQGGKCLCQVAFDSIPLSR